MKLAAENGEMGLFNRTQRLFNIYIPINLLMFGLSAVMIAFVNESLHILAFLLIIVLLMLNIAFIFLLIAFRKAVKDEKPLTFELGEGSKES